MQIQDDGFSVIALRQGTICGYSPRMRLDLVVNTMTKTALTTGRIVVNNPAIWRPILSIDDAVAAYVRSVEANFEISGIFNVASGNYTIGELGDYVKEVLDDELGHKVELEIKNVQDLRNYKVSIDKAMRVLSFKPKHDVESIVRSLLAHREEFSDFDNPLYYNIEVFKTLQRGRPAPGWRRSPHEGRRRRRQRPAGHRPGRRAGRRGLSRPSALGHADIEVADLDSVRAALAAHRPDAVLNTAAFHNMPQCEERPGRAFAVNAVGALNLARAAAELGARNVYFSTDYVFDGAKGEPYVETDRPAPLNVYGASKLAGERLSEVYAPGSLVLRVSGLYGRVPCRDKGENFITKMIALAGKLPEVRVVTDEILTPTPTRAIAEKTVELLGTDAAGLHPPDLRGLLLLARVRARDLHDPGARDAARRGHGGGFPDRRSRRPHYSVLANTRLAATGLAPMPHWREALGDFLVREHAVAAS